MATLTIRAFAADPATAPVPPDTVALAAFPHDGTAALTGSGPIAFAYVPAATLPAGAVLPLEFTVDHDPSAPVDQAWLVGQVVSHLNGR